MSDITEKTFPETLISQETGRPLRRGQKRLRIEVNGQSLEYDQPGWWASLDDPEDQDGVLEPEDLEVRRAVRDAARP